MKRTCSAATAVQTPSQRIGVVITSKQFYFRLISIETCIALSSIGTIYLRCLMNKDLRHAPIGDIGSTTGYEGVATGAIGDSATKVAHKYREDLLLLDRLTDRVYQLLQEDLYLQRERLSNYGRFR
jgi:hypothetical protein